MEEPSEELDVPNLLCDELAEDLFRAWDEEEAAQKARKGDFTITSSSYTPKAAEEEQKSIKTKCLKREDKAPSWPPLSGTESLDTFLPPRLKKRERMNCSTDVPNLLCDELAEDLFRVWDEEEAAQKARKGDFTITSSSYTPKAAEEEQKSIETKCLKREDQAPSWPPPSPDTFLPATLKKRQRVNYSTAQLQILEAFFHDNPFPEVEKKRFIAGSLGVTVKNISVWFQNRRAKEKKEEALIGKLGAAQSRTRCTPHQQIRSTLTSSMGASPLSTQMPPSNSSLLSSLSSPGQNGVRADHRSPLVLVALTSGHTLAHCDTLCLPIDTSQQSSTCNLQISYSAIKPGTSLPSTANLTPNPPNSNLTPYLILDPGRNATGVATISVVSFQSQSADVHSSDQQAGTAAYQSHGGNQGPDEDHQPLSSISLPQPEASLFQECSLENSQHPLLSEVLTSTTTNFPPVSALQLSYLSVENTPPEELLEPQVSAASPESPPVTPLLETDYDKYDNIQSHFHFSPTHFSF